METPKWNFNGTEQVYEPAEDSFLLLDALEADIQDIKSKKPSIILEIGSGSGVIITALAKTLTNTAYCMAVDISEYACTMTQETAQLNFAQVEMIQGDLSACLRSSGLVDVLIFNPPYVVTADEEITGTIQRAWAGGARGRVVTDRLLGQLEDLLSPNSSFYLVVIKENSPQEIIKIMEAKGFCGKEIAYKKIRGEQLSILRFTR